MNKSTLIPTKIENYNLRFAEKRDTPLILDFIRELAEYENLSHEVVATEDELMENLFGEDRYAEVILGMYKDQPAGFALFFHNFSTFLGKPGLYLEDLYVKPDYRGLGLGSTLLAYLAQLAVERGCGRLEWWVLDWNEPAISFYKKLGAQAMDEWTVYRLTGEKLKDAARRF